MAKLILALGLIGILVDVAAPQGTCAVELGDREDCGSPGITEPECINKDCCFDSVPTDGTPWCYNKVSPPQGSCAVELGDREECGSPGITELECFSRFCCFESVTRAGIPWCYKKFTTLQSVCAVELRDREECGSPGITETECFNINCCFQSESRLGTPACYNKLSQPQAGCVVGTVVRTDCGFTGITEQQCIDKGCCYQPVGIPGVVGVPGLPWCFNKIDVPIDPAIVNIGGVEIRLPDFSGCRLSTLVRDTTSLVESFIKIGQSSNFLDAIVNILENAQIFSISSYCGLFSLAVDALTGCPAPFIQPFSLVFPAINSTFYAALNALEPIRAPCKLLSGQGLDLTTPQCIPIAAELCPINSIDIVAAVSTFTGDIDDSCMSLQKTLEGVRTCISGATNGCPAAQRDSFQTLKDVYGTLALGSRDYCQAGCYDLILFVADQHTTCSWNLARLYPNPRVENYCEYAHFAARCGWMLWDGCPILPEQYFQNAMSVVESAIDIGGCEPVNLEGYDRNPAFQIELPPCVQASTDCAKELAFGVGVDTLMGEYGGYTATNVDARINEIGQNLRKGNYKDFCGNPEQIQANKNPIRDCINGLTQACAADQNSQAVTLSNTAADWYGEACVPGCYELGDRIVNFRDRCNVDVNIDIANIPINLFTGQFSPIGNTAPECEFVKGYAQCISELVTECDFIHNRAQDARQMIVKAIFGDDAARTEIYVCGVKLDYPFEIKDSAHAVLEITGTASHTSQLTWMTIFVTLISLLLYFKS